MTNKSLFMNILFSADTMNSFQASDCKVILDLIVKRNKVEIFLSQNEHEINQHLNPSTKLNQLDIENFNLILAYNRKGIHQINSLAKANNIPVIYIVSADNIVKQYPQDLTQIFKIILLDSYPSFPTFLFDNNLMFQLPQHPYIGNEKDFSIRNKEKPKIIVDIESKNLRHSPINKLIPLLNSLLDYEVLIIYNDPIFGFFNSNISLIDKKGTDIHNLISNSDIIIGSGNTIFQALHLCKPCVVVGEYGYGGIITFENIELLYKNNFQGRVGGYLDEYLPSNLIFEDIQSLLDMESDEINDIIKLNFHFINKRNVSEQLNSLFEDVTRLHCSIYNNIWIVYLRFSETFQIIRLPKSKHVIVNSRTKQILHYIEKEEAEIIELFDGSRKVQDVIELSGYQNESEVFLEFLKELLGEKILVIYEN